MYSLILSSFIVIGCLVLLSSVYHRLCRQWRIYKSLKSLPTTKDQHWLFGDSLRMLKEARSGGLLDYLLEMSKIGRLMHMSLGPFAKVLVCTHADPLKLTLGQNPKSELIYYPMYPWLGESLLTGNGKKWARTRRLLTPAFHFDILKPYIPIYESCAKEAIDIWKEKVLNGERIDLFPHISLLTLDVMLRCTCSYESNCQTAKTHSPYVAAVYELSDLTMQRIIFFPAYFDWIYALMPSKYRMDRACNIVHKFSMDVITKRRAVLDDLKKNGKTMQVGQLANGKRKKYLDFIDLLLEAKDENGVGLTNKEIRAEIDTFMFEGHDTTASSVAWTLYNLARYPEHQSKCREEVDAVFDDTKDYLTWEDVKGFQYLKYCIKESLRIFPPVPVIARNLPEDCEYEGQKFIEGTWCITDINAIHHNPDLWDDPEVFDPLRFTPENSKGRHPNAFIPFSSGSRNCIGQEFALNEEKVILAHILRNFEISLPEDFKVEKMFLLILRPKDGLYLNLKIREH